MSDVTTEQGLCTDLRDGSTFAGSITSASAAVEAAFGFSTDMYQVDLEDGTRILIPVQHARLVLNDSIGPGTSVDDPAIIVD